MKNSLLSAIIIVVALAAYSIGANKPEQPKCCCEHSQQTANELHELRLFLEKNLTLEDPGSLIMPKITPPNNQMPVPKARR